MVGRYFIRIQHASIVKHCQTIFYKHAAMIQIATNAMVPKMAPIMSLIIGLPFLLTWLDNHGQGLKRFWLLWMFQNTIGNPGI